MAFWQVNTGFKVWINTNPFSTWFNSGFSSNSGTNNRNSTTKSNKKNDDYTYNPRYPWFDEEDYKKLEKMVADKGFTWSKKTDVMDQLYEIYYPQVLNKHKLDERQVEINNSIHQNGELLLNGNTEAKAWTWLTKIAQEAKKKYNIPYNVDDQQLVKDIIADTPDWNKLLYEYVNNWNPEIFYAAWIWDRQQEQSTSWVQQWWVKSLINPASEWWILPENNKEWLNPIGAAAETVDNAANKFASKLMVSWEKAASNLADRINNMSEEEVARYRKQYEQQLKDKDWRVGRVQGDTIVEQLWNGIKWNISYDYNDEDFYEWLVDQKATLWESLIWADDILQWEKNPNVIQFFGNIPSSAVKTFTATVRGMTNPYDTMKWLYKLAATEEWHQALLQRYGSWDALANAMNTDPVWVADDVLAVAELWTNIAKWWLKATWKITWNQNLANMANNIPTIWSANDALSQKTVWGIYGWLDKVASMTDNKLVQWANRYVQDVSSMQKLLNEWAEGLKKVEESSFGQSIKNAYDEAVNKIVGIDEEDRKFIRENKELVNNQLSKKQNVETIFDEVKDKVSEKRLENTEMGKEYGNLRKNKSKVVNTEWITSDLKKTLKKQWITIDKDNNLKFSDMSKFNAKQKAALIDAWNELKLVEKKKNINAWNVLDMRQKFDDKLNWDGKAMDLNWNLSAVDKATEWLIKDMRWAIDNRAKVSVEWLKELDAKYSEALAEMQQIKKDWLNADGTFKDNARSKLRNLTKAWNEEKLARLEKAIPWITNDLKALDVALTIEKASKQWVWQYSKWILAWSIPAWVANPIAWGVWVVLWILSSPKNYVKLIEAYPDIAEKLSAWQELLPSDMNKLQGWASRIQDWMEE